jgi:hypothetical protein
MRILIRMIRRELMALGTKSSVKALFTKIKNLSRILISLSAAIKVLS